MTKMINKIIKQYLLLTELTDRSSQHKNNPIQKDKSNVEICLWATVHKHTVLPSLFSLSLRLQATDQKNSFKMTAVFVKDKQYRCCITATLLQQWKYFLNGPSI